jgi:CRISPR-associated protein, csn1 family
MNKKLSLSNINVSASRKVVNFKISSLNEFKIINESITGLYSNEVTIV